MVGAGDWRWGLIIDPTSGIAERVAASLGFPVNMMLIHLCNISRKRVLERRSLAMCRGDRCPKLTRRCGSPEIESRYEQIMTAKATVAH